MPEQPKRIPTEIRDRYLLLWDGQCDFCRRSVEWLHKRAPGKFIPLPFQEQKSWLPPEIFEDCKRQFYLRTPKGEYLGGGEAVIKLFEIIGWQPLGFYLKLPILRQLTGFLYRLASRNRNLLNRFFFKAT
jgi:predicted DCC family thiol-disulfide oxidoreductase YuxK